MTSLELLNLLKFTINIESPSNLSESQEVEAWKKSTQLPVSLRGFHILKNWILNYFFECKEDPQLTNDIMEYIAELKKNTNMVNCATSLEGYLCQILTRETDINPLIPLPSTLASDPSKSSRSRSLLLLLAFLPVFSPTPSSAQVSSIHLKDIHPEEVAKQLTLIDFYLFTAIKPTECLSQAWVKGDKEKRAPNILAMIHRVSYVSTKGEWEWGGSGSFRANEENERGRGG
jgi:hypothetical protein